MYRKQAKLHSCLNTMNLTMFSCGWKCRHRYSRYPATEYSVYWGMLSAIFDLRVKVVPPLRQ